MNTIFDCEPRIWLQKSGNFDKKTQWIQRNEVIIDNISTSLWYPTICGRVLNAICGNFVIGKKKKITRKK